MAVFTVLKDGDFGWRIVVTSPDGAVQFVPGPAVPPIGAGSARLFTGTFGDLSAELRNGLYDGTLLSDLTALSYWTYDKVNNGQQWPYIILNIDTNGDGIRDDLLFFEPGFQTPASGNPALPDQGPPILNTWQDWDALVGGWWSLNGIAGATPGNGVKPLSAYIAAVPNARIIGFGGFGGIRLVHGFASPTDVFDGNVDAFSIATTTRPLATFNFDIRQLPMPGFRFRKPLFVCHGTLPGVRTSRP